MIGRQPALDDVEGPPSEDASKPARAEIKRDLIRALLLAVGVTCAYVLSIFTIGRYYTPISQFDELAQAFLQGHLNIENPSTTHDLTGSGGKWYVPFPPLPALMLLPAVALLGVEHTYTTAFECAIGGANVALAYLIVRALSRRGLSQATQLHAVLLALMVGFGTVHWYMSIQGSVWFLGQVCALMFAFLAVWLAVEFRATTWAGVALAIAMLGRPTMVLMAPLLIALCVIASRGSGTTDRSAALRRVAAALAPAAVSVGLLAAYNYARFGDPTDFGYFDQNVDFVLRTVLDKYGQFDLHYVPHNLWSMFLAGPVWEPATGTMHPHVDGMSILLTTPALIFLVFTFRKSTLNVGAWISVALLMVPLLLYYNTGWVQFGYRFMLDAMPCLLVLLATYVNKDTSKWFWALVGCGVLMNAWGVAWYFPPDLN